VFPIVVPTIIIQIQRSGVIENLIVAQLVYKFLAFYESQKCLQEPDAWPCHEWIESRSHPHTVFIYFNIISATTPTPFPSGYQNKVTEAIL